MQQGDLFRRVPTGTLQSSHGWFLFDTDTGLVLESHIKDDSDWGPQYHPRQVDVAELRAAYPAAPLETDWDILDVGYFAHNGVYVPPIFDWRRRFRG